MIRVPLICSLDLRLISKVQQTDFRYLKCTFGSNGLDTLRKTTFWNA